MTVGTRRVSQGAIVAALVCLVAASVRSQAGVTPQAGPPRMAEEVLTNVQVLKGIPVDEFIDTMGMFSAALLFCCTDCHDERIHYDPTAFANTTPQIETARRMIRMTKALNDGFFK